MRTTILHLRLDAFQASVEQLRNPRLRGRPVIVGTSVIDGCSFEARTYGLVPGMPVRLALRLCPHATVVEGNPHAYRCFSGAVWEIARRRVAGLEAGADEALGELSGPGDPPLTIGRKLKREIEEEVGLVAAVGLASSRIVARMASASVRPDGLAYVPWGEEAAFVAGRPVEDLPGVSPAAGLLLRRLNVNTVADLQDLPLETVESMLGPAGLGLRELLQWIDPRPLPDRGTAPTAPRETVLFRPKPVRRAGVAV